MKNNIRVSGFIKTQPKVNFDGCDNCKFHYTAAGYDWCKLLDVGQPCPSREELESEVSEDVRESEKDDDTFVD